MYNNPNDLNDPDQQNTLHNFYVTPPNNQNPIPAQNNNPYQQQLLQPPQKKQPRLLSWYKRQRNISKIGIGCGALLIIFMMCSLCSTVMTGVSSTSQHTMAQITATPESKPTSSITVQKNISTPHPTSLPKPNPSPTPLPVTSNNTPTSTDTTLGQPLNNFKAKYGQLDSSSQPNNGMYDFEHMALTVMTLNKPGDRASAILYSNIGQIGWPDMEKATTDCRLFLPGDAKYTRTTTGTNGDIQRVYISSSIATMFDASDFTDEKGNTTTPGTIAIIYTPDPSNSNSILQCTLQVGLEAN